MELFLQQRHDLQAFFMNRFSQKTIFKTARTIFL